MNLETLAVIAPIASLLALLAGGAIRASSRVAVRLAVLETKVDCILVAIGSSLPSPRASAPGE